MEEKDNWLKFKKLFIRDAEGSETVESSDKNQVESQATQQLIQHSNGLSDSSLVNDFVQRLQNLINQNNKPGFDFLEFTESLFEEKQNPDREVYQLVFRIAQKIDRSLTPLRLLESAKFYKDLVQQTADGEVTKGIAKKQGLQAEKDTERTNLDQGLNETRSRIQQLQLQIQELQNQELTLNNQLMAIDQKYEGKFSDIDNKINAIRSAKEQVIVSIVDIEAGIKTNLS
jgi:hypothetical protein